METQFYLLLSLKTTDGFENYGQYFLGDDREAAYSLFDSLRGSRHAGGPALLHIDLMETADELPLKIRSISCTLEELASNSKLIAREIFRQRNLKAFEE